MFNFTAPRVTAADEVIEQAQRTPEEINSIENDKYGRYELPVETPEMVSNHLIEMEEALSKIPLEEKECYQRALEEVPDLVQTESKSLLFLRSEAYNSGRAARKLVDYWKMRVRIFGERAFSPMTLTGAMEDEVDAVSWGFMHLLPDDRHGRCVVYQNLCRIHPERNKVTRARVTWYMFHRIIMRDENTQKQGLVCLSNHKAVSHETQFDRKEAKLMWQALETMPIKIRAVHSCYQTAFYEIMEPFSKHLMTEHVRARFSHHDGEVQEVLDALSEYGLESCHLPSDIGGEYRLDIEEWLQDSLDQSL